MAVMWPTIELGIEELLGEDVDSKYDSAEGEGEQHWGMGFNFAAWGAFGAFGALREGQGEDADMDMKEEYEGAAIDAQHGSEAREDAQEDAEGEEESSEHDNSGYSTALGAEHLHAHSSESASAKQAKKSIKHMHAQYEQHQEQGAGEHEHENERQYSLSQAHFLNTSNYGAHRHGTAGMMDNDMSAPLHGHK